MGGSSRLWPLALVTVALVAGIFITAGWFGRGLVSCADVPVHSLSPSCGATLWMPRAWLVAGTVVATSLATSIAWRLLRTGWRQWRDTRQLLADIRPSFRRPGLRLQHATTTLETHARIVEADCSEPFAFCVGLAKPRIVVSSGLANSLEPRQLAAVLAHEAHHARRRDPLKLALLGLTSQTAFLFPALRPLVDHLTLQIELDADREAVNRVGQRPTLEAIAAILESPRSQAVGNLARFDTLAGRVEALMGHPTQRQQISSRCAARTAVAVLAVLAAATLSTAGGGEAATAEPLVRDAAVGTVTIDW